MDETDRSILEILQRDGRAAQVDVARRVGLSGPALNERLKKLERSGVIRGYAARLDDAAVGCDVMAFIEVFVDHPRHEAPFIRAIAAMDEVLECHHITGDASILLKVKTTDRASLKRILLDRINGLEGVRGTKTVIVLDTAKEEIAVPLRNIPGLPVRRRSADESMEEGEAS